MSFDAAVCLKQLAIPVKRIVSDSRMLEVGDVFVAYPGETQDGRLFIERAIQQGAAGIIWEQQDFVWNSGWQIPNVAVRDLLHQVGYLADEVLNHPSRSLFVVGVTGTNGKTSTTHWIAQTLSQLGQPCAVIGTLGNGFPQQLQYTQNTTPVAIRTQTLLAEMSEQQAVAVSMEVSSHALVQGRVNGVAFDVALFTNLTRDHLDYHGDMDSYAASKRCLFDWPTLVQSVINLDDPIGAKWAAELLASGKTVIAYGLSEAAKQLAQQLAIPYLIAENLTLLPQGLKMKVVSPTDEVILESKLIGRFNASNLLGVLGVLQARGIPLAQACAELASVDAVAGRMQYLTAEGFPNVVVDYAHTPDALEQVLMTLRETLPQSDSRLICVFGCGGDRDNGKRSEMGFAASSYADYCWLTSDNPRSEDPQHIAQQTLAGINKNNYCVELDRKQAIVSAIRSARMQDVVLVAGKGHEDYQEIAGVKYPFDDCAIVREYFAAGRGAV